MEKSGYEYGMIGLGTMGQNLVLNMSDHGFSVAGYDKDPIQVEVLNKEAGNRNIYAFHKLQEFIESLRQPRIIILLVPAGPIVDFVIKDLQPYLLKNDLLVDLGNSHFIDTEKRIKWLKETGIHFIGAGISGGESGARFGPSIMPGGSKEAYSRLEPMLQSVAARVQDQACVAFMGNGAAGHYVKMVHNGIEYALMQLIAESYHLLKIYAGLSNDDLQEVYNGWNKGKLQSFLMEITAAVFLQEAEQPEERLIDRITDTAHQKGTGAWMSQDAMTIQAPIPSIDAAVSQRIISSMKAERIVAGINKKAFSKSITTNKKDFINQLEDALHACFIITYAQGLAMLQKASGIYKYEIDIAAVASIWRGGCIIRSAMLEDITLAFSKDPALKNLMLNDHFAQQLDKETYSLKGILKPAINAAIPVPAFSACNSYYDSYHSAWLPANLIQAQRDFFGAHTYERLDMPGIFHTNWNQIIH